MPLFEPEPAASSPNTNRSPDQDSALAPIIGGVLEFGFDIFDEWSQPPATPAGGRVRVNIGDAAWITSDQVRRIAYVTQGAREIELIGRNPQVIADTVRALRQYVQEQDPAA